MLAHKVVGRRLRALDVRVRVGVRVRVRVGVRVRVRALFLAHPNPKDLGVLGRTSLVLVGDVLVEHVGPLGALAEGEVLLVALDLLVRLVQVRVRVRVRVRVFGFGFGC